MHSTPAPWSRLAPYPPAPSAWSPVPPAWHPVAPLRAPRAETSPVPGARGAETPPALYVLGSFALMLVLAAVTGVFGSVAALALVDAEDVPDAPLVEVSPPAASVGR
ncbi:MAG: hypothetical protein KF850_29595 [Labilithrix sp.]|nr:hypothetical protein [Labilithrix sp.]MBX3216230.1 hypothetical protein [Labilithrix sp.]